MEPSIIRSTLMGLLSSIILGSFTMFLVLICIRWCLCSFCAAFFSRRHPYDGCTDISENQHSPLRIGIYDREGLAVVLDNRASSIACITEDKSGLPTYEEAVRNMNKVPLDGKNPEIIIDPM